MKKHTLSTVSPEHNLSVGSSHLIRAIKEIYPDLSDSEVTNLGNILLEEVSSRMKAGERIAFVRTNSDGRVELTLLGLEILEKKKSLPSSKSSSRSLKR
jgi:hypothetical protein